MSINVLQVNKELEKTCQEYLALDSQDGKPKCQELRQKMRKLLDLSEIGEEIDENEELKEANDERD